MGPFRFFLFLAMLGISNQLFSQKNKLSIAPTPAWITNNPINYNSNTLEEDAEDGYFDISFEKQVLLSEEAVYYRKSYKILNETGVENASEVSVNYDPVYQQLIFHTLTITRGGEKINKLKLSGIKTLQLETDRYRHQYDGSLTAFVLLDDVREGDIVEYSYTLKGFNPIFGNRYSEVFQAAFSVPFGQLFYKVIVPKERSLYYENYKNNLQPVIIKRETTKEYEWRIQNLPAVAVDDYLPSWFDPYPAIAVSEFNDWHMVREWARKLFPAGVAIGPALQKKIDEIKKNNSTNEMRTLAALRFVQDDIRYLSITMGTSTHQPNDPNKVYQQRYGDCKDKTYLLTTMLQAMDIAATPVLVNTTAKATLHDMMPSPKVFDHVTVKATVDNREYYLDPTINLQRGNLPSISYPDYNTVLVLAEEDRGLTTLSKSEPGKVLVTETFDIPDMKGGGKLKVITVNTGTFADDARSLFHNNSKAELLKDYKTFYSSYFPKIKADSLAFADDEETGAFTVTEYYTLVDLWTIEDGQQTATFVPFVINSLLRRPDDLERKMPMSLNHPANYREVVVINLPEKWTLRMFDRTVKRAEFMYAGRSVMHGNSLTMYFDYQSYRDHVEPHNVAELINAYDDVQTSMGYTLTYGKSTGTDYFKKQPEKMPEDKLKAIYIRLSVFFSLLFVSVIAAAIWRRRKRGEDKSLQKIKSKSWEEYEKEKATIEE